MALLKHFIALGICLLGCLAQLQFPSNYVVIPGSGMTLYFEFNDQTKRVLMGLDKPQNVDYFAVGFADEGHYGMDHFDMVAFVFGDNAAATQVLDLYSSQYGRPPTDVSLGGTADYNLIDSYVADGRRQVLFDRAFDTRDIFDYVLDPSKTRFSLVMSWAWNAGTGGFAYHTGGAGTVLTQLYNGFQGTAKEYSATGLPVNLILKLHGYIMLLVWGLLAEIAIQIGRYRKYDKHFIAIHAILNTSLYVLTILALSFALYVKWGQVYGFTSKVHLIVSIVILVLTTLQVVLGIILRNKVVGLKETDNISRLNRFHFINGLVIYFITKLQLGTGLYLFEPSLMVYFYIYLVIVLTLRVFQEYSYLHWERLNGILAKRDIEGPDSQDPKHQKLLDLLNTPVSEIKKNPLLKDLHWAILDDKVFSTEGFNHPGGNFIKKYIQGREIGRFTYGAYPLELYPDSTQHQHSSHALKLIEKHLIGTIKDPRKVLIPRQSKEEEENSLLQEPNVSQRMLGESSKTSPKKSREWALEKKTTVTPTIAKFEFSSKDFLVNTTEDDVSRIGRHMKVTHVSQKKTRLYTLVLSQTEVRVKRRAQLWEKAHHHGDHESNLPNAETKSDTLPLIIKKYDILNGNTLSSFIHSCDINTKDFIIEGPYGTGLELTPNSKGIHYIFAAGTGVFPFLDLFDYLFENLLGSTHGVNLFKNGFKVRLFASFGSLDDFVGLDMCEKLIQGCKHKGMADAFQMIIRAKGAKENENYQVTDRKMDNSFIDEHVDIKNCEKAYVCGPPEFNLKIGSGLEAVGLEKSKIIMV